METKKVLEGNNRGGGKKERKPFQFEFSGINFPSRHGDLFRSSLTSVNNGVVIWLESKKSKQQWQATITDVGECGPSGVPEDAVVAFMKVSFIRLISRMTMLNNPVFYLFSLFIIFRKLSSC